MILTAVAANLPCVHASRFARSSATCSLPRSRSHHRAPTTVPGEVAVGRSPGVRRSGVAHAGVGADDRVLPAGDAERVEVALALEEAGVHLVVVGRGQHPASRAIAPSCSTPVGRPSASRST